MKLSTLSFAVLTLFGVFALSGCGSDNQQSAPSLATTTKDEIAIPNGAEPESLDLHKASDSSSFAIIRQMFVGLVSADEKGATIPALASEWDSADGRVWTFKIRDAKWSDDTPITSHDFVYSFRRLTDPNTASPYSSYLVDAKVVNAKQISDGRAGVETLGVRAVDDKTLEITLTDTVPYLPDLLVLPVAYAVPKHAIETHGDKWLDPANIVVSGAYKLTDWVVNSHIKIERNPAYFGEVAGNINKATFLPLNESFGGSVNVSIINQEWKTMLDTRRQGKFDTAFAGWCSDYNEPSSFLNVLRSDNSNNSGKYANQAFDHLLDSTLNAGLDDNARMNKYHEAEQMLDKDVAILPIYNSVSVRLQKPYLQAESLNDPSNNWQIKDWSFDRNAQ